MTVTSRRSIAALEATARTFGGLDMLVLNAGIFPGGRRIAALDNEAWRKVMSVNLDANLMLLRECHPLLKLAPRGGRVVVIGSKNVPAPGPGRRGLLGLEGGAHTSSRASPRSNGAPTTSASTRCIRTRCSTPASGTTRC